MHAQLILYRHADQRRAWGVRVYMYEEEDTHFCQLNVVNYIGNYTPSVCDWLYSMHACERSTYWPGYM